MTLTGIVSIERIRSCTAPTFAISPALAVADLAVPYLLATEATYTAGLRSSTLLKPHFAPLPLPVVQAVVAISVRHNKSGDREER